MIKVVIKKPGEVPYTEIVDNELKSYQRIVGGSIETVRYKDFLIVCNEEGKLLGLAPNFFFGNDLICGTAFFVGIKEDSFASLNEKQINDLMGRFIGRPAKIRE